MKLWLDDIRSAPEGWEHIHSVNEAVGAIVLEYENIEVISLDHDAGDYYCGGGDYIRILDWLEFTNRNYAIRIHSMNSVGVQNMRAIIQRNGWKEVF